MTPKSLPWFALICQGSFLGGFMLSSYLSFTLQRVLGSIDTCSSWCLSCILSLGLFQTPEVWVIKRQQPGPGLHDRGYMLLTLCLYMGFINWTFSGYSPRPNLPWETLPRAIAPDSIALKISIG